VTISVIAVISAMIFPLVVSAKQSSYRSVATNNLKQFYLAIQMYSQDHEGDLSYPDYIIAKSIIPKQIQCDASDYWHKKCPSDSTDPLIGSYAYSRAVFSETIAWREFVNTDLFPVATTLFFSSQKVRKFSGLFPSTSDLVKNPFDFRYPDQFLTVYSDGHVSVKRVAKDDHRSERSIMGWVSAFEYLRKLK
jgi:type II secretory pathway pseudopilin PulG